MAYSGWIRGLFGFWFILTAACLAYAGLGLAAAYPEPHDPPQPSCPIIQVELLALYDTGQWDFFTSSQNEFFFDVYTDQATSKGNGSTSQILTPAPLPTYYSDPEAENIQTHHGLVALLPTAGATKVGVTWLENDTMLGVLSRDGADKVAEGFLFLDKIQGASAGLERTLSGKKQSDKRPRAKFKFTCLSSDVHAEALVHTLTFEARASGELTPNASSEEFPDNPVLRAEIQEGFIWSVDQSAPEVGLSVHPRLDRLAFKTLENRDALTNRLRDIQTLKIDIADLQEKLKKALDAKEDIVVILDALLNTRARLEKLEVDLAQEVISLEVWLTGDFSSLIHEDYQKQGLGPFALYLWQNISVEENTETGQPLVHEDAALTLGFQGNYVPLMDQVVNGKLGEYPFGNLYQRSYTTIADIFNHLTYLNVLSNRQSLSFYLNPEADRVFIYGFEQSEMVPMWGALQAQWMTLSTEPLGSTLNRTNRLEEVRRGILFLLTLSNAEILGLDPKLLSREYLADIKSRLNLLPRDIALSGGE